MSKYIRLEDVLNIIDKNCPDQYAINKTNIETLVKQLPTLKTETLKWDSEEITVLFENLETEIIGE